MNSNTLKTLFLSLLTAIMVFSQNFKFMPDDLIGLTPVNPELREKHAIELLGSREYKKSAAAQSPQLSDLHFKVFQYVRNQLDKKNRPHAFRIARTILDLSHKYNFDPVFVMAIIKTESSFNPHAVGGVGEIGLMQIRPETARWIAKEMNLSFNHTQELRDPVKNIEIGVSYMHYLRQKFESKSYRYIAAYNMGPRNVRRLIAQDKKPKEYATRIVKNYNLTYERMANIGLNLKYKTSSLVKPSSNVY
ncbi:MAG: lytic transglycosylase domain-containing protein [Bdellovibrionales bacterium]